MKPRDTPSSRDADLYRKAAKAIESGDLYRGEPVAYACHALELAHEGEHTFLCVAMKAIFAPDSQYHAWLNPWSTAGDFSTPHDVRILALCFMAAIAENP